MALNCANWTDKQLDELSDLLQASDYSAVAAFIAENFLATGSRIMTDPTQTTLRVTVNGGDGRAVDLSAGVFLHNSLVAEVDSTQVINILNTAVGTWGTGQQPDGTNPRWDVIEVKQNELLHTAATRWFVDDTVVPNTYYEASVNTLINKAYYDIVVKHGTAAPAPVMPTADAGYWIIAEIYVPADAVSPGTAVVSAANIYDTGSVAGSQAIVPNWTSTSRVLRLEFWSTLFGVDHDPVTGYHRAGGWHIGATTITTTGTELNRALSGAGATVTAANLTTLTNGSNTSLHTHGIGAGVIFRDPPVTLVTYAGAALVGWTDLDLSAYAPAGSTGVLLSCSMQNEAYANGASYLELKKKGGAGDGVPPNPGLKTRAMAYATHSANIVELPGSASTLIVPCDANRVISYRTTGAARSSFVIAFCGYLI